MTQSDKRLKHLDILIAAFYMVCDSRYDSLHRPTQTQIMGYHEATLPDNTKRHEMVLYLNPFGLIMTVAELLVADKLLITSVSSVPAHKQTVELDNGANVLIECIGFRVDNDANIKYTFEYNTLFTKLFGLSIADFDEIETIRQDSFNTRRTTEGFSRVHKVLTNRREHMSGSISISDIVF